MEMVVEMAPERLMAMEETSVATTLLAAVTAKTLMAAGAAKALIVAKTEVDFGMVDLLGSTMERMVK